MSLIAFLLIIASATFHATWNLLLKKDKSGVASYIMMCLPVAFIWLNVQFWTPVHVFQLPAEFWTFLILSVAADLLYAHALFASYSRMDMISAYPMMRSLPIIMTMIITSVFSLGAKLTTTACLGMLIVFCGCLMMPLKVFGDFNFRQYCSKNMLFIILVAAGTTGYTIFDSLAQHALTAHLNDTVSKTIQSITYYSTRCIALNISLQLAGWLNPSTRATMLPTIQKHWKTFLWAGLCASLTYCLVLIAMNYVTNVTYVQVFRQLGLPIGMLAAAVFLKEKCTTPKLCGVILILSGLAISVTDFSALFSRLSSLFS